MVGAAGFEPATPRPPGEHEAPGATWGHENPDSVRMAEHEGARLPAPDRDPGSSPDALEGALTEALVVAARAGDLERIGAITSELRARREARLGVLSLDAVRRGREGKK